MALISCPECNKQISDKAVACPNCGLPLKGIVTESLVGKQNELVCPIFPRDMSIGNACFTTASGDLESFQNIKTWDKKGNVILQLCDKGIAMKKELFKPAINVHFTQMIDLIEVTESEIEDKSVLGRALVGGVLFGGIGAIVGGISGTGSKKVNKYYVIMNFWDKDTRQPASISISSTTSFKSFIEKKEKMRAKYKSESGR